MNSHKFLKKASFTGLIAKQQTDSLLFNFPVLKFAFGLYNSAIYHSPNTAPSILWLCCTVGICKESRKKTQFNRLTPHDTVRRPITQDDTYNKHNYTNVSVQNTLHLIIALTTAGIPLATQLKMLCYKFQKLKPNLALGTDRKQLILSKQEWKSMLHFLFGLHMF